MSADLRSTNGSRFAPLDAPSAAEPEDELRVWARKHLERVRRLKMHVAAYVLGMLVLTPVWAFAEYESNGGFQRFSDNSQPGDWEPWILYVALGWGLFVVIDALKVYFDRPTTEAEIDREITRLSSRS